MLLFATFAKADFELFIPTFIRAAKETVPDFKDVVVVRKHPSCLTSRITEEDYPDINRYVEKLTESIGPSTLTVSAPARSQAKILPKTA